MRRLLIHFSADYRDEDVEALATAVEDMAGARAWRFGAPRFVNEEDASSCSSPEDEPIKTVGCLLDLPARSKDALAEQAALRDVKAVFDSMATFSRDRSVEFEALLNDTYVGDIRNGEIGRLVREGLFNTWHDQGADK